jgi:hypothetical protein
VTLTEFLLARIEEDEAVARAVESSTRRGWEGHQLSRHDWGVDIPGARVLAECEAKRQLVEWARYDDWTDPGYNGHLSAPGSDRGDVLGWLGAVYADHPDYQEEWRA